MTWKLLKQTGSGQLKWRVRIAGCPIEFVTHPDMVRDSSGFDLESAEEASNIIAGYSWVAGPFGTPPTITTGQTGPTGASDATQISDSTSTLSLAVLNAYATIAAGDVLWITVPIKKDFASQGFPRIGVAYTGGIGSATINFQLGSGRFESTAPFCRLFQHPTNPDWWLLAMKAVAPSGATGVRLEVYPAAGSASSFPNQSAAATGSVTIGEARIVKASSFTVPERRLGLATDGFKFAESVELPTAKWKAEPFTVRIADIGNHATRLFSTTPAVSTYLRSDVSKDASSLPVLSTDGFDDSGDLWINTETIHYTSKNSDTFLGCTRHTLASGEQAHYTDSTGERAREVEVTSWPQCFEGRRVYIYAYGAGDAPMLDGGNDGEPVWRGVMSTEPRYNGLEWSFGVDSLARFLDQELAADLGEAGIRGIYYPATAPLCFFVGEFENAGGGSGDWRGWFKFAIAGYWETLDAFLDAVNVQLAIRSSAPDDGSPFKQTITAVPKGEGWALEYLTDASTPLIIDATVRSATDFHKRTGDVLRSSDGASVRTVAADTSYYIPIEGGGFPRATIGRFNASDDPEVDWTSFAPFRCVGIDATLFPHDRIYLGGHATLTDTISVAAVSWSTTGPESDHERAGTEDFTAPIISRNASDRWIRVNRGVLAAESPFYAASGEGPEIKLGRVHSEGSLATFLQDLVDDTPDQLNRGTVPDLRASDIDLTDLQALLATSEYASPIFSDRRYAFYEPAKLSEIIEHECMLLGVYPCLASDGRLSFQKLSLPILAGARELTSRQIIIGDQLFTLEKSAIGLYNTVVFQTGYNALEDEHKGSPYVFRNLKSYGKTPLARTLEIAPKSEETTPASVTDLDSVASALTTIFGVPYQYLTIEVPFTHFDAKVGEVVSLTWKKLPNALGKLGVTEALGLVVSRSWEPWAAKGMLTLYFTGGRFAGYVPSAKILGISDDGGKVYTLLLDSSYFAPGKYPADHWEVGNKVRVYRWNDIGAPIDATVTVAQAGGYGLQIQTDSPWDFGSEAWAIGSQGSGAIMARNQKAYVYVAAADGRITFADAEAPPFVLGP